MSRRNPRREALLADTAKKQRAVGQKVSRLEKQGIRIRREGYDPRQNIAAVRRMSTRELRKYNATLTQFNSRETSFRVGFNGTPLPAAQVREYGRLQQTWNSIVDRFVGKFADVPQPGSDTTAGVRRWMLKEGGPTRMGGVQRTFVKDNRLPAQIEGPKELGDLVNQLKDKIDPNFLAKRADRAFKNLQGLLDNDVNRQFIDRVKELSPEQQVILFDETGFVNAAKDRYYPERAQPGKQEVDYELRNGVPKTEEDPKNVGSIIDWVETNFPKGGEYSDTHARSVPVQFNPNDTSAKPGGISLYNDTNAKPIRTQRPKRK